MGGKLEKNIKKYGEEGMSPELKGREKLVLNV